MSHECPECGQLCYCDMEDHESEAPDDCRHQCPPEPTLEEYYDELLQEEIEFNGYC